MRHVALRIIMWASCAPAPSASMARPGFPPGAPEEFSRQSEQRAVQILGQNPGWAILGVTVATLIAVLLTLAVAQVIRGVLDIEESARRAAGALSHGR